MDFSNRLLPTKEEWMYTEPDYFVWCSTLFKFRDAYYMIYSRWEKRLGFEAWVTDSRLALAKADHPLGKFTFVRELWSEACTGPGERLVLHNPTVLCHGGRIYLYFMMTHGTGKDWWENRNRQRIGVAYTNDPEGEWTRLEEPILDVSPQGFDALMVSNPTVTEGPDGKILMLYKAVSKDGPPPKGGAVICGACEADSPLGPFRKFGQPLFQNPENPWAVEDPYVWFEKGSYYALCKDFNGYFTGTGKVSTALFQSADGHDWQPADPPLAYPNELIFSDHSEEVCNLERPQLFFEKGKAAVLLCACRKNLQDTTTYSVRIPMIW